MITWMESSYRSAFGEGQWTRGVAGKKAAARRVVGCRQPSALWTWSGVASAPARIRGVLTPQGKEVAATGESEERLQDTQPYEKCTPALHQCTHVQNMALET